jgi:hypothetical protein
MFLCIFAYFGRGKHPAFTLLKEDDGAINTV